MYISIRRLKTYYIQVKWDVMKRKDVPKKVKPMPTAPLVLICEMIRVVTVACSTSTKRSQHNGCSISLKWEVHKSAKQCCVSQYCRKITMLQGERPTGTEPYEVPAYEDGEIKHSMRSSIQHHIVRSQSFLQTDLPLLPVNTQNAEWRVRDEQRQADRQQTSYLSGHPSWTPMI